MSKKIFLSYEEVFRYLGATSNSRCATEGECILNAGLVMSVGCLSQQGDQLKVLALVLQTSGLTKEPLKVEGVISIAEEVTLIKFNCTCKAGQSEKCKHVAAVLWYLHRNDIYGLEELSSTDVKCLWKKTKGQKQAMYSAKKIREFCHVNAHVQEPQSEDFLFNCLRSLLSVSPGSALALHMSGRCRELPEDDGEEEAGDE